MRRTSGHAVTACPATRLLNQRMHWGMYTVLPAVMAMMAVMANMMAPVPRAVSIIPVVCRSHDDGRRVHDGRRWGNDHGGRSHDDRDWQPNAHRDMNPSVGRQRQGNT